MTVLTEMPRSRSGTAADAMSAPLAAVDPGTGLLTAWELMTTARVRYVVVVSGGRCVGVVDDRQMLLHWPADPVVLRRKRVGDMLRNIRLYSVLTDTPVTVVADLMAERSLDAVPVVTNDGDLVGVVSAVDLMRYLAHAETRAHLRAMST